MKTTKNIKTKTVKPAAPKAKRTSAPKKTAAVAAPKAKTVPASAPQPAPAAVPAPTITVSADQVARRAYFIWEQQGRPTGKEREHWLLAEQQLKAA